MCGLAGYAATTSSTFITSEHLSKNISKILLHRGPDGSGVWASEKHRVCLVHRRLSILDPSDAGAQPMFNKKQDVVVVFNGEIYNFRDLRSALEQCGHSFTSDCDTEVLLYAYHEWGIDFIERLDGMFAFALYDLKTQELFLVRDRIGVKPLYFSLQGGYLSFASEIKALWELPWMQKNYHIQAISHYLTFLVTPAPMTMFEGVYKLPAGYVLRCDAQKKVTFRRWYDLRSQIGVYAANRFRRESEVIRSVRTLLKDAVKKRMIADVPVGALLSGGVDSGLNVALMAEHTNRLSTFNVSFAEAPEDHERAWARKVARRYNTNHYELIISEVEAFSFLQKMVHHQDEPLGDCVCVPLYYVSKLARDAGVHVVQVGEGSDELFCGYNLYAQYLQLHRYWEFSQKYFPHVAKKGIFYAAQKWYDPQSPKIDLIKAWQDERKLFWSGAVAFSPIGKEALLEKFHQQSFDPIVEQMYPGFPQTSDSYAIADYHREQLYKAQYSVDFLLEVGYIEFMNRLPELLLMRIDKMAMAASVEARVPFLDHRLVELVLSLPMHYKYRRGVGKYILKKVAEPFLPREIIYRKKMGFTAPVHKWFYPGTQFSTHLHDTLYSTNSFLDMFDKKLIEKMILKHQTFRKNNGYQLWALQNLFAFAQI